MANIIKIKRGLEKDIASLTLQSGELAVALDTQKVYVGDSEGNVQLIKAGTTGAVESADKLTTARTIATTGDATGSASFDGSKDVSIALTLANSGVAAGTYTKVTVDAKGRVTAGSDLELADLPTITVEDIDGLKEELEDCSRVKNLVDGQAVGSIRSINAYDETKKLLGQNAQAFGYQTQATGACSHAEGRSTVASGGNSHAEGHTTTASGYQSHAEGIQTLASALGSHAEGYQTKATQERAHAEGSGSIASGIVSHAEGNETTASGGGAHAEGSDTVASADAAHAEGGETKATGICSHAEGNTTEANGSSSHAEGTYSIASGDDQHVQGKCNIADTTSAHIVGNGVYNSTTGEISKRSNAHTIDWSGNAWFAGDVYVGSTSGTNKDEGSKKLATEEFVDSSITSGIANKVDKISGKGLSTEDYTSAEKTKLASLENYDDTAIKIDIAKKADSSATATALATKVDKVDGKQLSTEDYTSTEKTKLNGIEEGAEKNIISSVSSELEVSSERVLSLKAIAMSKVTGLESALDAKANAADVYTKTQTYSKDEVDAKVASVYKYKGSVASKAALPTSGQTVGDVYNVEDTGMNVAWDGKAWDELGISIDLTPYLTKDEATTTYAAKATTLAGYGISDAYTKSAVDTALDGKVDKVSGKGLSTNDYTTTEKNKLSGIATGAEVNKIDTVKVNGTALTITNKAVNVDLSNYATKSTTLAGYGITNAYTKSEVDDALTSKLSTTDTIDGGTF